MTPCSVPECPTELEQTLSLNLQRARAPQVGKIGLRVCSSSVTPVGIRRIEVGLEVPSERKRTMTAHTPLRKGVRGVHPLNEGVGLKKLLEQVYFWTVHPLN